MNDRIAQMAREAGLVDYVTEQGQLITDYGTINEELRNFARLVAEDLASHVERKLTEGRSPLGKVAANFIRERYK